MTIPTTGIRITGPIAGQLLILEMPVGGGAFGDVFLAREEGSGMRYAVKFPRLGAFGNPVAVSAFLNEVLAAQRVVHPNVVRIVHVETASVGVPPYLVMEYLPDGTLDARLRAIRAASGQVSVENFHRWASALVSGMTAINAEVLHRDLKPDNILMDGDTPKIGDFGLAKIVGAVTRSQTFKGGQHLLYMAPEGWKNETNTIQLDMYALGIVLYEIAALRYPYTQPADGRDVDAFRQMHLFQAPHSLQSLRPDLPSGYVHAITRLMAKRAEDRFKTWEDVKTALENAAPPAVPVHPGVGTLLAVTQQQHESAEQTRLAAAEREAKNHEKLNIDRYMESQLQAEFDEAIAQFNAQSSLGEIAATWDASVRQFLSEGISNYHITLPLGSTLRWTGFGIDPPLALRKGQVRRAVVIKARTGIGLHYLLCRTGDTDIYGRWVFCEVTMNALLNQDAERRYATLLPFENAEDIQHIARGEVATHVYYIQFKDDLITPFLSLIAGALRGVPGGR